MHSFLPFYRTNVIISYKTQLKGGLNEEELAAKVEKKKTEQHGRLTSDCRSKPYSVIVTVKLCVVAGNEVGSQNPDGTGRGGHIQTPEGDSADIPFNL